MEFVDVSVCQYDVDAELWFKFDGLENEKNKRGLPFEKKGTSRTNESRV